MKLLTRWSTLFARRDIRVSISDQHVQHSQLAEASNKHGISRVKYELYRVTTLAIHGILPSSHHLEGRATAQ